MDIVRFGIIGFGNMGSGHGRYFAADEVPHAKLTAVCDIKPDRLEAAKEICGDSIKLFENYEELMDSGLVDAVIIATPHYLHPPIAIKAFEKGLHVLSEKPAGVYTRQVREMNEAAKKSGLVFGIMYNQRTTPAYQKAREMVQGGELGELKRFNWIITDWFRTQAYYNSGGWRATWSGEGGGVLINQCPHNLDLWQWICGMPTRVHAFCQFGKYHNIEVEDDVTCYAEYANGATAVFITTTGEAPGTNRMEIDCDKGKIVIEDGKFKLWKLDKNSSDYLKNDPNGFAYPEREYQELTFEDGGEAHKGITKNFTNAILNGTPLLAPGYEGINGLNISNAMHLSSWTNDWVEIPVAEDLYYEKLMEHVATSQKKEAVVETVFDTEGTYGSR